MMDIELQNYLTTRLNECTNKYLSIDLWKNKTTLTHLYISKSPSRHVFALKKFLFQGTNNNRLESIKCSPL